MTGFPLRSIIRRHMGKTGRYFEASTVSDLPVALPLAGDEDVIGWYCNPSPWDESPVVFTESAIYSVEGGRIVRISLREIRDYEFPRSKDEVSGVRVLTAEGSVFVRVAGARGADHGIKDAFDFIAVIRKIAGHNQR